MNDGDRPPCPQARTGECPNEDGSETDEYLGDEGAFACGACGLVFDSSPVGVVIVGPHPDMFDPRGRGEADTSGSTDPSAGGTETRADGGTARPEVLGLRYERFTSLMALAVGGFGFCSLVWALAHYVGGVEAGLMFALQFAVVANLASVGGEVLRYRARRGGGE